MEINTCLETTKDYHVVALYSHLIPAIIAIFVSIFVVYKSNFLPARIFSFFVGSFALWLIGDVIIWTSTDYNLVTFLWAPLDYINVVFYLFGAYFFTVLVRGRDIHLKYKILLALLISPAWWITFTNQSISEFYQPVCEAFNNELLTSYKFYLEYFVITYIMFYAFIAGRKSTKQDRMKIIVVSLALILFFATFSVTEYISSTTGIYEINLYSLFVLPIFLFIIVYAISDLEIFKIRFLGFELLPYVLVFMVGSQFFFLEDSTYKILTVITFALTLGFAGLLLRSGRREVEARNKVEALANELEEANLQLKELDRQKDELLSIVSHQLATPVTSVKWYLEMLTDGDLGKLAPEQEKHISSMQSIATNLSDLVSMILDVSRIQLGKMRIDKQSLDLNVFFKEILETVDPKAIEKHIEFAKQMPATLPEAKLDRRYTRMTIENLLTNAIKYTPENGKVNLKVEIRNGTMYCEVKDTGYGIPKAEQDKIFGKLFRASNVRNKMDGNGFGLYVAKGAVEAQGGKIWFKSEEGKGTTFFVELPLN